MQQSDVKQRLTVMNFLQFAVWGSYLTSMGSYLFGIGWAEHIGYFYAVQGLVSIFMPALMGIVADRFIPAQRLLGICHAVAGSLMVALFAYTQVVPVGELSYGLFFGIYTLSVAFYMPTLALSNSVAYSSLERYGLDIVKVFPPIRVFGTVGFICCMLLVDFLGYQQTSTQFLVSGIVGLLLALFSLALPHCPIAPKGEKKSLAEALGLNAFALFKQRKMALFFIFSMLLGVSLQITNGFANPFITSFGSIPEFANTFGAQHANALISLSQVSETLCILLIPFLLRRLGIKWVMLIAMLCWVMRFGFFALGNPGDGVWLFVLSMIVYGMAFDFFNVSGSLFVDKETDTSIRSSAQGLFMLMTNGIGASIGTLGAQWVINHYVNTRPLGLEQIGGWQISWGIFAGYSLAVAILFFLLFQYKEDANK